MRSLEVVLQEMKKYDSPSQRVVVYVNGFDHYFDTTVDGAHVAIGDMSKLSVKSVDDHNATERWLPVIIDCVTTEAQT